MFSALAFITQHYFDIDLYGTVSSFSLFYSIILYDYVSIIHPFSYQWICRLFVFYFFFIINIFAVSILISLHRGQNFTMGYVNK